jgi:hypothetical protein
MSPADCNSNTASASVTLRFLQPVPPTATDETFSFSGSNGAASITRPAGTLTSNDKWSTSCLGSSNRSVVSLVTPPVTGQLSLGEDGGFTYSVASTSGGSNVHACDRTAVASKLHVLLLLLLAPLLPHTHFRHAKHARSPCSCNTDMRWHVHFSLLSASALSSLFIRPSHSCC